MVAATSEDLVALSATQVIVHPLVLLSVTDHAARVSKSSSKRVVGVLLGQDNSPRSINVSNSFACPFEEDDRDPRTWFLDHNYVENMGDMFKKISSKESLVGWYHTGPKLRASDLAINDVFKRYCSNPVMVIVDVRPQREAGRQGGSVTDAYFAVEEIKDDGTATTKTFVHVSSTIEAEESEEIGVEHLLRDIKDLSTGTLSTRVADRLESLQGLHARLMEIKDYLESVIKGELPVNHQIVYNLQNIFSLLPNIDLSPIISPPGPSDSSLISQPVPAKEYTGGRSKAAPLTVATNDQLLVVYLSSLVRAVIALHALVNNKLENQASARAEDSNANGDTTKPLTQKDKNHATTASAKKEKTDEDRGL